MNSTGRELSQADLIRNYVLMGLEPDHQTSLYRDHWRPMEVEFSQRLIPSTLISSCVITSPWEPGEIPNIKKCTASRFIPSKK